MLSISVSLVAVFLPILLMGGIVGRLFREFALTLSLAIAVSLVVSLTVTPMMCSRLLEEPREKREEGRVARWLERQFERMQRGYARTLGWALGHPRTILLILLATIGLNFYLYVIVPKGFPAAGHGAHHRRHSGGPEHVVSGDEGQVLRDDAHCRGRSRRR